MVVRPLAVVAGKDRDGIVRLEVRAQLPLRGAWITSKLGAGALGILALQRMCDVCQRSLVHLTCINCSG